MFSTLVTNVTLATCCHSMERRARIAARADKIAATFDKPFEGNGMTSLSEPLSSISPCQPGNVARIPITTTSNPTAASLERTICISPDKWWDYKPRAGSHKSRKHNGIFEITSLPDQVRWILIRLKALHQVCCVAATAPLALGISSTEGKIPCTDL